MAVFPAGARYNLTYRHVETNLLVEVLMIFQNQNLTFQQFIHQHLLNFQHKKNVHQVILRNYVTTTSSFNKS
ncbi:MAG: hypothetical protein KME59_04365 [Trichormus sp. ATA11-4-KO1]|jgi:hypothetical protein|nr:hypothetical protein [Trichormus sp. ATA11-4-KO1]